MKLAAAVLALSLAACSSAPPSPAIAPRPLLPIITEKEYRDEIDKYKRRRVIRQNYTMIELIQEPYNDTAIPKRIVEVTTMYSPEPSIYIEYEKETCSNTKDKSMGRPCMAGEIAEAKYFLQVK